MDNNSHNKYLKYLKYKSKYYKYKNQLGGTKEENNTFLLHGTNLYYIDDIIQNGLTGKYNNTIYNIIKKYWERIRHLSLDGYVDIFLTRQDNFEKSSTVSLSFTGKYQTAEEYSKYARKFGEGPSRFLKVFSEYINKNKSTQVTEEIIKDYNYINDAYKYPGIILAINIDDFRDQDEIKNLKIENLDQWEYTFHFIIPPDKLYIRKEDKEYILLTSKIGIDYIKLITKNHEEQSIKLLKEHEDMVLKLSGWTTEIYKTSPLFYVKLTDYNRNISIRAQYDIYDEEEVPHYLQITINNYNNININILIINILQSENYKTIIQGEEGFDLFINNEELLEKCKFVIGEIIKIIPPNRNKIIFQMVKNSFISLQTLPPSETNVHFLQPIEELL